MHPNRLTIAAARAIFDLEIASVADAGGIFAHHPIVVWIRDQDARRAAIAQLPRWISEQAFRRLIDESDLIDRIAVGLPHRFPYRGAQSVEKIVEALIGECLGLVQT